MVQRVSHDAFRLQLQSSSGDVECVWGEGGSEKSEQAATMQLIEMQKSETVVLTGKHAQNKQRMHVVEVDY